jgi:hypothetical protein
MDADDIWKRKSKLETRRLLGAATVSASRRSRMLLV